MSELFTPTTGQVSQAYEVAHEEVGAPMEPGEFWRWLDQVRREAKAEALQAVLVLANRWEARGRSDMSSSATMPPDIAKHIYSAGHAMIWHSTQLRRFIMMAQEVLNK